MFLNVVSQHFELSKHKTSQHKCAGSISTRCKHLPECLLFIYRDSILTYWYGRFAVKIVPEQFAVGQWLSIKGCMHGPVTGLVHLELQLAYRSGGRDCNLLYMKMVSMGMAGTE